MYEPAKDGLARRERGRKKDATKTVLEQEAERRKHRRSTDDVWLADDDDSAKNVDVEGSFSGSARSVQRASGVFGVFRTVV